MKLKFSPFEGLNSSATLLRVLKSIGVKQCIEIKAHLHPGVWFGDQGAPPFLRSVSTKSLKHLKTNETQLESMRRDLQLKYNYDFRNAYAV